MAKVKLTRSTLKFFQGLTAIKYKIKRKFEPRKKYVRIENIHYGTDKRQVFDLYYTNTEKKNILLINIHGGFYVGSSRKDNFMLAHYFLRKGIDVALIEYRLNDDNIETKDEMQDVNDAISFIYNNLDLLRLTHDKIFIMGDSAGGHFALMNALAKCTQTPLLKDDYKICGVMLNCPAYNYQDYHSYDELSNGLKRWILGKNYKNPQYLATLSCKSYISNLKLPIFVSTSSLDFLRKDVLDLISDLDKYKINYTFVDIKSNNPFAGHVHNVMRPRLKESIKVNKAMYEFMLENVEKEEV